MMLAGRRIPLGRHLNGDEAASKGAAICASNHSLIVRDASLKGNRRIWLEDGHHRSYSIGWDGSGKTSLRCSYALSGVIDCWMVVQMSAW